MEWVEALVLLLVGAGATYLSQRRIEQIKGERELLVAERARVEAAELRLRDERVRVYTTVLDPYIEVLHEMGRGASVTEANRRLSSTDHRKAAFQLKILGSDDVVRAFNSFSRYIIDAQRTGTDIPGEILRRWANLIFAIRRSVGEESTGLSEPDMIIDWVADIETVYPDLRPGQTVAVEGGVSFGTDRPAGAFARVGSRTVSMQRLEELRVLAGRFRDGELSNDELVDLFARIPDAPGAEVLLDPGAYFAENGRPLDVSKPRVLLDAIERQRQGHGQPHDDRLIDELVQFMREIRGRRISVVDPRSDLRFEIRA